jgi:hypothetical protein
MDPKDIANLITEDVRTNNGISDHIINEDILLNEGILEAFKQGLKGFIAGLADKPVGELSPEEVQRYSAQLKNNPNIVKLAQFAKYFDEASKRIGKGVASMLDDERARAAFQESWANSCKMGYGALMNRLTRLTRVDEQASAEAKPAEAAKPEVPAVGKPGEEKPTGFGPGQQNPAQEATPKAQIPV